jgi:hypothetical protein
MDMQKELESDECREELGFHQWNFTRLFHGVYSFEFSG